MTDREPGNATIRGPDGGSAAGAGDRAAARAKTPAAGDLAVTGAGSTDPEAENPEVASIEQSDLGGVRLGDGKGPGAGLGGTRGGGPGPIGRRG
jgi:hypothetical protein